MNYLLTQVNLRLGRYDEVRRTVLPMKHSIVLKKDTISVRVGKVTNTETFSMRGTDL